MSADHPPRILIVEARFYSDISDALLHGAKQVLDAASAAYNIIEVPGAMEIPAALRFAVIAGRDGLKPSYDGFVPLGCVVRGETSHYDHVCHMCFSGIQKLVDEFAIAVGVGVLSVENKAQAEARASVQKGDKGGTAARACLAMIEHKRSFGLFGPMDR